MKRSWLGDRFRCIADMHAEPASRKPSVSASKFPQQGLAQRLMRV